MYIYIYIYVYIYISFQSTNWLLTISTSLLESFPLEAPWTTRSKNDTPWLQGALPAECPPCSDGNDRRPHPQWHHCRCCLSRGKRCPGQRKALGARWRSSVWKPYKLRMAHVKSWCCFACFKTIHVEVLNPLEGVLEEADFFQAHLP